MVYIRYGSTERRDRVRTHSRTRVVHQSHHTQRPPSLPPVRYAYATHTAACVSNRTPHLGYMVYSATVAQRACARANARATRSHNVNI